MIKNIIGTKENLITGYLDFFLGGLDGLLCVLITFVVIEYITALMLAVIEKSLSSDIGVRDIFKRVLIFFLVGVGHMVDLHLIKNGTVIRTTVIFFYISNVGIDLLENSANIGLPVPQKLKNIMKQLKNNDGEEENYDN